jgi:hypothetical protein
MNHREQLIDTLGKIEALGKDAELFNEKRKRLQEVIATEQGARDKLAALAAKDEVAMTAWATEGANGPAPTPDAKAHAAATKEAEAATRAATAARTALDRLSQEIAATITEPIRALQGQADELRACIFADELSAFADGVHDLSNTLAAGLATCYVGASHLVGLKRGTEANSLRGVLGARADDPTRADIDQGARKRVMAFWQTLQADPEARFSDPLAEAA